MCVCSVYFSCVMIVQAFGRMRHWTSLWSIRCDFNGDYHWKFLNRLLFGHIQLIQLFSESVQWINIYWNVRAFVRKEQRFYCLVVQRIEHFFVELFCYCFFFFFSWLQQTAERSTATIRYIDTHSSAAPVAYVQCTRTTAFHVCLFFSVFAYVFVSITRKTHIAYTRVFVYRSSIQYFFFFFQRFLFFSAFLMRSLVRSISIVCSILPFYPEKSAYLH